MVRFYSFVITTVLLLAFAVGELSAATPLTVKVTDSATRRILPVRVYLQSADGGLLHVRSASPEGSAVEYHKQRGTGSIEIHTTVSAHPFTADLAPGKYTLTIERGKDYLPVTKTFDIGDEPMEVSIAMRRWIDMASRGWYSGDTHVHRSVADLPNVLTAEDLNVALPLTHWVTKGYTPPTGGNKNTDDKLPARLIKVDETHVIYPLNTEYEIFTINGKRHTLGAVFILNHKKPFKLGAPPVGPIAAEARRQGGLLELDKHSWPWSMMLVPVMNVDLFELSNNHVWRTNFHFRAFVIGTKPRDFKLADPKSGFNEREWVDFGFQSYYTLLNCGFHMRPTAGTASGVHPVPLGFGRVYVQLEDGFNYEDWMRGLDAGRSFVTTGPMLLAHFNGQAAGHHFGGKDAKESKRCRVTGTAESGFPLSRIEIVKNGDVVQTVKPQSEKSKDGGYRTAFDVTLPLDGTSWVAVRCYEQRPGGRERFAHTAPVHFDVPGKPLHPRRAAIEYLIGRMKEELARSKKTLRPDELEEYRQALRVYEKIAADGVR